MTVLLCSLGILLTLLVYSKGQVRPNWDMPRFGGRDWGQNGFNFDLGQNDGDRGRNPFGSFRPNQMPTQQPPIVGQIPGQIGQRGQPGMENRPPPLPPMPQEPGQIGQGELPAPSQPPPDQGVSQVPTPLEPQPSPGPGAGMGPGLLGGFSPSEFPPLFLSSTSPSPDRGFGGSGERGFPSLAGPNVIGSRGGGVPGILGGPGMGQGPQGFGRDFPFDRSDRGQGLSPMQPPMGQAGQGELGQRGDQENASAPPMSQRGSMEEGSSTENPPFLEDSQETGKTKVVQGSEKTGAEPLRQFGSQGDIFELSKPHRPSQKDGHHLRGFRGKDVHPKVPKPPVTAQDSPEVLEQGMSPEHNGVEPIKQVEKPRQREILRPRPNQKGDQSGPPSKILVIPNTPDIKDAEIVPPNLEGNRGHRTPPPQIDVRQGGKGKGEQGELEGTGQSREIPDYVPRPPRGK